MRYHHTLIFVCLLLSTSKIFCFPNEETRNIKLQESLLIESTIGVNLPENISTEELKKHNFVKRRKFKLASFISSKAYNESKLAGPIVYIPRWLYILGALLGIGWLLMALMDRWRGANWWIALGIPFVFLLFGWPLIASISSIVFAFAVMRQYY